MEKKNIGNLLALYPKPMTVVGAEVEGKVNWLVVGHTGYLRTGKAPYTCFTHWYRPSL